MLFHRNESLNDFFNSFPVTSILIIINLALFTLLSLNGGSTNTHTLIQFGAFFKPLVLEGEFHRFFTYMFLHIGFQHLLFNTFSLYVFASSLEKMIGKLKYLLIYFISGLGSAFFVYLFSNDVVVAGASGSIFGVFGTFLILILKNSDSFDPQSKQIAFVIIILNIVFTFFGTSISIAGHIGGFVFGFFFSLIFVKK